MEEELMVESRKGREGGIKRKLMLVDNPSSIVVTPRTREGHLLMRMTFGFDRAMGQLRQRIGTYIDIQASMEKVRMVEDFISGFKELIDSSGGGENPFSWVYENPEVRRVIANERSSHVILPRTNEAREITLLIKRFDPMLFQFRSTCTDFSKSEEVIRKVVRIVLQYDNLIREISSLVGTNYDQPREISFLKSTPFSDEEFRVQEEVKKGRNGG